MLARVLRTIVSEETTEELKELFRHKADFNESRRERWTGTQKGPLILFTSPLESYDIMSKKFFFSSPLDSALTICSLKNPYEH